MSPLPTFVTGALARLGVLALVFAAGAWAGHAWQARATDAAQADELRRLGDLYLQAVADGAARANALDQALTQSQTFASDLAQRSTHVPTLARSLARARCPQAAPGPAHPGPPGAVVAPDAQQPKQAGVGTAALPAPAAQDAPPERQPAGPSDEPSDAGAANPGHAAAGQPDDAGLVLTAGAVSLWNSALAGAVVPAGACRLDDPASAACAADTGVTLEDAWDNQAHNAATCRDDRARLAALIAYLSQTLRAREAHTPHTDLETPWTWTLKP